MTKFSKCLPIILRHEGGYVDHPDDPGGATNMGITHKTLAAWRGRPVSKRDVRNMTKDEAAEIYRANYWNALSCDALPRGIDLVVFDFGVNAGVSRSAKTLQRLIYVDDDGDIGPVTIAAVERDDPAAIINGFSEARMAFYRALDHWGTFKDGWTRRSHETREAALDMARKPAPPVAQAPVTLIQRIMAWLGSIS